MTSGFNRPEEFDIPWQRIESLRIRDHVSLTLSDTEKMHFVIDNIEPVPFTSRTDSTWQIASNATRELTTISDWLEPGNNTLYVLRIGVYADQNVWVFVRNTGTSGELYGIKDDPIGRITPNVSPYHSPRIFVSTYPDKVITSFRLENRTRNALNIVKLSAMGLKFKVRAVGGVPERSLDLNLIHLSEGGT